MSTPPLTTPLSAILPAAFASYAATATLAPAAIMIDGAITGNFPGQVDVNRIRNEDTTGFAAPQASLVNLLSLNLNCGGVGSTGGFNTLYSVLSLNRPSANNDGQYTSGTFVAQGTVNDGGTLGAPKSAVFGINPNVRLVGTATFWKQLIGGEINIACGTGASVRDKIGLQIVQTTIDAVDGSACNVALAITSQAVPGGGTTGWDVGYCFGAYSGTNAIKSTGTLIGTFSHAGVVGGAMGTCAYGIDLAGYTFTGAPIVMPLQTPASAAATGKQGSMCWDANFVYVCVATNTWKRAAISTW